MSLVAMYVPGCYARFWLLCTYLVAIYVSGACICLVCMSLIAIHISGLVSMSLVDIYISGCYALLWLLCMALVAMHASDYLDRSACLRYLINLKMKILGFLTFSQAVICTLNSLRTAILFLLFLS